MLDIGPFFFLARVYDCQEWLRMFQALANHYFLPNKADLNFFECVARRTLPHEFLQQEK